MKKNFKYFAMASVALLGGLSSCSNNDMHETNPGESKSVHVQLTTDTPPSTYAASPTQNEDVIKFNTGVVYFIDASGIIRNKYILGEEEGNVTIAQITEGHDFMNINGAVENVFVVGNTQPASSSTAIASVRSEELAIGSQASLSNVNLWGLSETLIPSGTAGNGNSKFKTTVNLAPTVARIEISDIIGGGDIEKFTVDAIFVDDFYKKSTIDGTHSELKVRTTNAADYLVGTGAYTENGITYDTVGLNSNPITTGGKSVQQVKLDEPNIWGYNIFAPVATEVYTPRIIIKLSNIKIKGVETTTDTQFITIKGFTEKDQPKNVIAGHIYKINAGDLVFDETNLTPNPNQEAIDVEVTVVVPTWKVVPVKPNI